MGAAANRHFARQPHILIIDDDDRIRDLVARFLHDNGFVVCTAHDAAHARDIMKRLSFDALVVDVMMPGESGLEFTQSLRPDNDIPVVLLTALGEVEDRVTGLQSGADDYLSKPFEPQELVLRLQAILRRRPQPITTAQSFHVGPWHYDPDQNILSDNKKEVRLTTVEATLLQALASKEGHAVSREELAVLCDVDGGGRTIDVQVTRLRRKLEVDPKTPRYLQTVRGKGYRLLTGEGRD